MAVVQGARPGLTHKLGAVGGFHADIFFLRLVDFLMGVADSRIRCRLYRAHGKGALYMRPLGFYFLLKFQPFFCFAGLRVGSRLHPQFFPGRQTRLGVLQLLFHTLGPAPRLGQLFIRRLRWQLVSGKFQLGRPFRFSLG
ncbi:hypothetical protein MKA43_20860 [[Clostridium] innocuum]|nr:hypothetical protein [[Clostridium] innocuum]